MSTINNSIFDELFLTLKFLDKKKKLSLVLIAFAITISSFLEILSIGAVIPFISSILDVDTYDNSNIIKFFNFFKFHSNNKFFFSIVFIFLVFFSASFRIFTNYLFIKFSKEIVSDFSIKIFKNNLNNNLIEIKKKNINNIVSIITEKLDIFSGLVLNLLNSISALFLIFAISIFLLFVNYKITLMAISFIFFLYLIIILNLKSKLSRVAKEVAELSFVRVKKIKESLGNFRQIDLDNSQLLYSNFFTKLESRFRNIQFKISFLGQFPRFLIETIVIIFIAVSIYYFNYYLNYKLIHIIPLAGVFVFSTQKLLPLIHQLYNSYINLSGYYRYVVDIRTELIKSDYEIRTDFKYDKNINLVFNKDIVLNNLDYKYHGASKPIFNQFNLKIVKGSKCAIIGKSGVGKTTLLDILIGIYELQIGKLLVDNEEINLKNLKQWKNKIAYVPQEAFLFDDSIAKNISLELDSENIDQKKLIECTKLSEIYDFINNLPKKFDTFVGENGAYLSGGQKQRIGIARALYKNKEILVLDEATNALDSEAEEMILKNLANIKDITIIQVTHKINSSFKFDQIIKL
jgi:ATP-binding cassette subfamily B protein